MANYSLVVDSTFKPFTYQELAAPLDREELYHEKLAEEYDKLSTQADVLEAMGQNDRDKSSGAYNRYKAYSDKLRKEADDLYKFGLNTESRQRLSDLRRMYNTEIVPIQNAWTTRKKEVEMQMQARIQHPELRFTRDAVNTSLDEYVRNPEGGFGVVNLNKVAADMSAVAKNLAKQAKEGRLEGIDEYTSRYITPYGLDPNLIRNWQNNPNVSPTLTNMMQEVLRANGISDENFLNTPNGRSIMEEAIGAARNGAWSAIGEDKEHIVENYGKRLDYQKQKEIEVAQAKEAAKNGGDNGIPEMPNWAEERSGIKTADGYVTDAQEKMAGLKAGQNGLKASIFGKYTGSVNPIAVYEDYQRELTNHQKEVSSYSYSPSTMFMVSSSQNVPDTEAAKKATLAKYSKYGVSDIITPEQYSLLKSLGYDNKSKFGNRYSEIGDKLDALATQYTRYSTKMAGYDLPDSAIRTNILRMPDSQFKAGKVWELKDDGTVGDIVKDKDDLNLKSEDNTKGTQVADIQYDPRHKGKLLITFGSKRYIVSPDVIDAQLTKALNKWETARIGNQIGYDPRVITGMISKWLNDYNKTQSKTSSKE